MDEQTNGAAGSGWASGQWSRRSLFRRAAVVAIAVPGIPTLLAACGGQTPSTSGGGAQSTSAGSSGSNSASTAASSAANAKPGGSLVIGLNLEPDNLDPAVTPFAVSHTVMMNIYDPLVWRGDDGNFVPGLADKWEASSDGLNYSFTLKSNVKFHDGTAFNADAVKFTLDHIVDPASHSGFAANLLGPYDHTEVSDPTTAKVVFKQPFAPFLDGASQAFLGIVSPTAVQKDGKAFLRNPIGTGFMKFKEWAEKDHITLVRNPDYNWSASIFAHKGTAYLDQVTFRFYTDDPTRLAALESGDVQDIETIAYSDLQRIKSDSKYTVLTGYTPGIPAILMLDTTKAPTTDLTVRQALNYATDRNAIVTTALFGASTPATGPLWSSTPGYSKAVESYYPHDASKAGQVLQQAGWVAGADGIRAKGGQRLSVTWSETPSADAYAELLQAQWRQAGVELQIQKMTTAAAFQAIEKSQVNTATIGWISSDPVILSNLFLSTNINGGYAWTKYANSQMDDLLNQAQRALDEAQRANLYGQVQKIIMDQALIVPLYGQLRTIGILSKFQGIKLDFRRYQWLFDAHTA